MEIWRINLSLPLNRLVIIEKQLYNLENAIF